MKTEKKVAERIVEFSKNWNLNNIPNNTKKIMRLIILDWISVTLAGQKEPVSKIIKKLEKNTKGKEEAFVIGLSKRLPVKSASLINAVTGHALDYDDTHFGSLGHTSVVVISAALAVSDQRKSSAKKFRGAVLIGMEIATRMGIWLGRKHYHQGFHITATAGIFGSTVAVARILGLSKNKTLNALSIASSLSSGIKGQFGSMAKPLQVGIAASKAVDSVIMAQKGITGDTEILDKSNGYGKTYLADFNDVAFSKLGKKFLIDDIKFKFHACCHGTHAALEALIYLRDKYKLKANLIDTIKIITNPQYLKICNIESPKNGLEIKFSYKMLSALIISQFNTASLRTYTDKKCKKENLLKISKRVKIISDEKISETKTKVIINLRSGKILKKTYDLTDKISFSLIEKKLFYKAKSLLGGKTANKLWLDSSLDKCLPSNWMEMNL